MATMINMHVSGDWGKALVLGVQSMVAEEGDAAAADGLARLARETGLARWASLSFLFFLCNVRVCLCVRVCVCARARA